MSSGARLGAANVVGPRPRALAFVAGFDGYPSQAFVAVRNDNWSNGGPITRVNGVA
jgi:hypothetical protein